MPALSLIPHPDTPCTALDAIRVRLTRESGGRIALNYALDGNVGAIVRPQAGKAARADKLWETTCFEAFIRLTGVPAYVEINLSFSGQWAAYEFTNYRQGMVPLRQFAPLHIAPNRDIAPTSLSTTLPLGGLPMLAADQPWQVGLSAVIEERNGCKSYWALRHPAGNPDFHHPDCFALDLPAAKPA